MLQGMWQAESGGADRRSDLVVYILRLCTILLLPGNIHPIEGRGVRGTRISVFPRRDFY